MAVEIILLVSSVSWSLARSLKGWSWWMLFSDLSPSDLIGKVTNISATIIETVAGGGHATRYLPDTN